ncbi:MAG TPA: ribosome biogenesis GTPase Der [Dehalococcoidia bacterium]|nr:ribosome biogenesis GTPase Der [Dehalococcoidia bacterium]
MTITMTIEAKVHTGKPLVAIVGRANVGKSSLFNRIVGKRTAIVEDLPGTTRDRLYADTSWEGKGFTLIDTGGLEIKPSTPMSQSIKEQVEAAMAEADVLLFVVDVREGLTASDWDIADSLRRSSVQVILVGNKADDPRHDLLAAEFNRLGCGEPITVSAHHGRNVHDMLDRVAALLPLFPEIPPQPDIMKVAIVGRPNVGKSMLLNAILGEERAIVSEVPGTTRDSLDTVYRLGENPVLLIDTAGMRRRGQIKAGIEHYSVLRSVRAIARSDVSVLVIDGSEGVTAQDLHIAGYVHDAYKGTIILVNKWDLVPEESRQAVAQQIEDRFKFVAYAPAMFISAKLRQGIELILPQAERVWRERQAHVPQETLAGFLEQTLARHGPPRSGTKQLKVYSLAQAGTYPPTFTFSVNDPEIVHFSYRRYLENSLRQSYGYYGSPLFLTFRKRGRVRASTKRQGKET